MMDEYPEDQPNKLAERQPNHVSNTHRHLVNTSAGTMQMNSGIMVAQLWIWLMGGAQGGGWYVCDWNDDCDSVYMFVFSNKKKNPYCIYFYMCIECLHVACRWCLSVFIYASFLCLRLILFFHIHLYYILSCMCDYANLHRYTYVFIFVFVSIYSERTFCAFSLCGCTHVLPPADSPPISAWQRDKFTLRSSPVDMQGAWTITIDIAMVTVALLLPETYNATMQCMPECVCVCVCLCQSVCICVWKR